MCVHVPTHIHKVNFQGIMWMWEETFSPQQQLVPISQVEEDMEKEANVNGYLWKVEMDRRTAKPRIRIPSDFPSLRPLHNLTSLCA